MLNWTSLLASLVILQQISAIENGPDWLWTCDNRDNCKRDLSKTPLAPGSSRYQSLALCRLVCGKYGALWPKPSFEPRLSQHIIHFHPSKIHFVIDGTSEEAKEFLQQNGEIFKTNVLKECKRELSHSSNTEIGIRISVNSSSLTLDWSTDESYKLDVNIEGLPYHQISSASSEKAVTVKISSQTVFGARHALETLSQLVASYPGENNEDMLVIVAKASVQDRPVYPHRGLLIDTARNYLTLDAIKRQIDGLAASKMNVLHWHATDSQSFPLALQDTPEMSRYGAYSQKEVYTPKDIRDLLSYAKTRGVRIVMEIDAPAHAGSGWQWGQDAKLGDLVVCFNKMPWRSYCIQPPCGQLNPINPNTYKVLGQLYRELIALLPKGEVFHMGGDEIFFPCWNSTDEILDYLESNGRGRTTEEFMRLWSEFQDEALRTFDSQAGTSDTPLVVWSSDLTQPKVIENYLPKERYVIQTWVPAEDELNRELLELGYRLIVSTKNKWYLDHGLGWASKDYHTWRDVYRNRISRHKAVLGGEACMWGELVDDCVIDERVWPRAAAVGERLWSDPVEGTAVAETRMYRHRQRLISRGIKAEGLAPEFCYQDEGHCY